MRGLAAIPASREDQPGTLELTQHTPRGQEPPGRTRAHEPGVLPHAGTPAAALTARWAGSHDPVMRPPPARLVTRSALHTRHPWRCLTALPRPGFHASQSVLHQ